MPDQDYKMNDIVFYFKTMDYDNNIVLSSTEDSNSVTGKCRVCGKQSAGLHYLVPTCHGCKSFFRRAVINRTVFKPCLYNQQCYSDRSNKPLKCRHCRYAKCFEVGMVAHVMSERKSCKPSDSDKTIIYDNPTTFENQMYGIIDQLLHLELKVQEFRGSAFNPIFYPRLDQLLFTESNLLSLGSRYGPMPGWPLEPEEFCKKQLETNHVQILDLPESIEKMPSVCNAKEWLSFDMLTSIEYAKTFPFFQELSYGDKLLVAQATTFMTLSLTSSYCSYENKMAILQMPDGICISGPGGSNEKELRRLEKKVGGRMIEPMIRESIGKIEYVLLKAMVLCNNAITDLSPSGQKILRQERQKYCNALLAHCRNTNRTPSRMYTILGIFDLLEHYQRDFRDFMIFLDLAVPDRLSPKRKNLQHEVLRI